MNVSNLFNINTEWDRGIELRKKKGNADREYTITR